MIFTDRGGGHFELTDEERHAMWTLGKTAALAASVRIATSQQDAARIDLAREIHERVVQRLFGVSLVLGSERGLSDDAQALRGRDAGGAGRPATTPAPVGATEPGHRRHPARRASAADRHHKDLPPGFDWQAGVEVPDDVEALAQSVLAEALRNADKHAEPTSVRVYVGRADGTFVLEVRNDGARPGLRGTGMAAARSRRGAPARSPRGVRPRGRERTGACDSPFP